MKITVRFIKNFEYRTIKQQVVDIDENMTIRELKDFMLPRISKPFLIAYDCLKIYFIPFHYKSQNLVINMDKDDEWILKDTQIVKDVLVEQCEVSFFNFEMYKEFQNNPNIKW
eukprot:NODE_34_length_31639_cov_0.254375.p23 type:complete len:113 gc:universal NODE_34_length_31639_cov_0.254375:22383-22721(+)